MSSGSLHPWNTAFAWTDHRAERGPLTPDQVARFDREGFTVVPDLLSAAELAPTVAEVDHLEQEADAFLQSLPEQRLGIAESGAITFAVHLVARSPLLRRLSAHPAITGICADLVGPDVRLYWDQAVYKKPEKPRRFPWHQDNGYTFVEPQAYLTVWLALTDATAANGCPQVAVGEHRRGTLAHRYVEPLGYECFEDPPELALAEVPAGGAVVFSSLTPHLTGPNTTGAVRKAYILQYAPAGARVLRGDPASGPPQTTEPCDHPGRQYEILRRGRAVAEP